MTLSKPTLFCKKKVMIVGMGYVGLSLFEHIKNTKKYNLIGFDVNQAVVLDMQNSIASDSEISISFEHDKNLLEVADIYVICVPTPLKNNKPSLEHVLDAAKTISKILKTGDLVVLESTCSPGTTQEILRPVLEESGLVASRDFYLGFASERVDPGNANFGIHNTAKVISGMCKNSSKEMTDFYSSFVESIYVTPGVREAELSKLIENTYRQINMAFVNELAKYCHVAGIDVWESIRAAATKPFGFEAFFPGPGVGGHCIPVDPMYLSDYFSQFNGKGLELVNKAQEINSSMPGYILQRTLNYLPSFNLKAVSPRVLLIGVGYKSDTSDVRNSPFFEIYRGLAEEKVHVDVLDFALKSIDLDGKNISILGELPNNINVYDLVVVLQHSRMLSLETLGNSGVQIFDTRGIMDFANRL